MDASVDPNIAIEYHLRDGTPVMLRAVRPEDRERMRDGFANLSPRSRQQRFFRGITSLSDEDLDRLTIVDQHDHVAWGALDPTQEGQPGVAMARFVRDATDPSVAEIALVVIDEYQGRGLGTLLLAVLMLRAEALGIHTFRALSLLENDEVSHWLRGLGATTHFDGLVCEFRLTVEADEMAESLAQSTEPVLRVGPQPLPLKFHPPRPKRRPKRRRGELAPATPSASRIWLERVRRDLRPVLLGTPPASEVTPGDAPAPPVEPVIGGPSSEASDVALQGNQHPDKRAWGRKKPPRPPREKRPRKDSVGES